MKKNLILLSFLLAVINCFAGKNPNIILILADDMGPGEPSHMGGIVPTPALDRMAMRDALTDVIRLLPSALPPAMVFLRVVTTGGVVSKEVLGEASSKALMDPNRVNLPNFLQQNGYHTYCGEMAFGADWEL